jgi:16S rRNA (cytosine1402-N4)-methyltransferase
MSGAEYHVPVLLDEVLELFVSAGVGVCVDGTLGGGGHFRAIAERLSALSSAEKTRSAGGGAGCRAGASCVRPLLIGIDRDAEAVDRARRAGFDGFGVGVIIEQSRFSEFDAVLRKHGIELVDGLFVDLGVSSRQIDEPARGFAYMRDAPLDMRMDSGSGMTAAEFLERCGEEELAGVLENCGEIRNAPRLAKAIKSFMRGNKMETSADLKRCITGEYGERVDIKLIAKLFQALRITINGELEELKAFLDKSVTCLAVGGRVAVISYHSLEDRIVKEFFRNAEAACVCAPNQPVCTCGKQVLLRRINRKAVTASEEEIRRNPRARSARLRVAERC